MKKMIKYIKNIINNKTLFCDLDGTLIETKCGEIFPKDKDDWQFKKWIKDAILEYNPKYILIVTNQGGIEKGFVKTDEFYHKLRNITKEISSWNNDFIVDYCVCTSNNKEDNFRKPNIGMFEWFYETYGIIRKHCLMIGDASGLDDQFSDSDLQFAKNANIKYTDVKYFIEAMIPCSICIDNNYDYLAEENIPMLYCDYSKSNRLKQAINIFK